MHTFTNLLRRSTTSRTQTLMASRPSSDAAAFRKVLDNAKHVLVLTGAGVSAESGIPTFRGAGGLWRTFELATPGAFAADPGLVWEFYHYRRELVQQKQPNAAHFALAEFGKKFLTGGAGGDRSWTLITQNVDNLHERAGSTDVVHLHGSLFRVRCTKCGVESENMDSPICDALKDTEMNIQSREAKKIAVTDLPRCTKSSGLLHESCCGLLRPAIVWFGESLDDSVLSRVHDCMAKADLAIIIGTSSVVYPAAGFASQLALRGVPVAEFNLEKTGKTPLFGFFFEGPAGETLPKLLQPM